MARFEYEPVAGRFGALVAGVRDWDAPTPVPEWRARDIVGHLTTWLPGFLEAGGVHLPTGGSDDPVAAWHTQDEAVRTLLAERGEEPFTHPYAGGPRPLAETIGTFYTPDVFMHSWDLARASGQDDTLDPDLCAELLGMEADEERIRASGQFGVRQPVAADADAQTRLIAFIGRDPGWAPPLRTPSA